ncbi:MAG: alpha/beta fold hydrolase [Brevirhabdus sp.]
MLNRIAHGTDTNTRPLVIAHGLFGSARNWGVIAKRLSDTRRVIAVDMRNHGASFQDGVHDYNALGADLISVAQEEGPQVDLLGHSMGGKAAMVAAVSAPESFGKLVVADIAPVPYTHTQMPVLDAMRGVDLARVRTRADAGAQLESHLDDPALRAFLLQSLDLNGETPRWKLNLDVLAREMDKIIGFPELDGVFDGPALFLSGAASNYVLPEHRDRIRALFPQARFAKIPEAGHWLHAEKPREFEAAIRAFLDA